MEAQACCGFRGSVGEDKIFLGGEWGNEEFINICWRTESIRSGITCTMAISLSKHKMDCYHTVDQHFDYVCYPRNYFHEFFIMFYFFKSDVQAKRYYFAINMKVTVVTDFWFFFFLKVKKWVIFHNQFTFMSVTLTISPRSSKITCVFYPYLSKLKMDVF